MSLINPMSKIRSDRIFTDQIPFSIHQYAYVSYEELEMHVHDFIEIVYVYRSKGLHKVRDHIMPVSEGDLFIINHDTPHCIYPYDRKNTDGLLVYNCMFLPAFIEESCPPPIPDHPNSI